MNHHRHKRHKWNPLAHLFMMYAFLGVLFLVMITNR